MKNYDVIIVGSGPNGLSAANVLAEAGLAVCVMESRPTPGGGLRTEELTLPDYLHDRCSAIHPMAILSPYLRTLNLDEYGLKWCASEVSVGQPLDDRPAALLVKSVDETAARLGVDANAYKSLVSPFLSSGPSLLADLMGPLGLPRHPLLMARFGLIGLRGATSVANSLFKDAPAKALFGGCAAHSILPLDWAGTAALGLIFSLTAHLENWPVAEGGSVALASALIQRFENMGGVIEVNRHIQSLDELPTSRFVLFDTSPAQMSAIAGDELPNRYKRRLKKYVYGPGVFKLDWALSEPIPWKDQELKQASTVHVGGTLDEMASAESTVWKSEHPEKPFVLVGQQSALDATRAPGEHHTGYAYTHVPSGSAFDMTSRIEDQIERFAPGFKDIILERHVMQPADFAKHNANYVGGAITGGAATINQLFTRPVARINPYTTPNSRLLICSASTPPGGGVHGMCGYHAAKTVLRKLGMPVPALYRDPFLLKG